MAEVCVPCRSFMVCRVCVCVCVCVGDMMYSPDCNSKHTLSGVYREREETIVQLGERSRGVRHERKSRTLWQKSIGNHWKSVGNHGNLARNQKSGPSRNQEISEKSQEILEKHPLFV